ncbi:hypothetical protein F4808DRAFT_59268 [Astrocystis sublimbata]|nr:hypothetical protein F4808DRAFT_59268 [Astrocystis sublimbata]
MLTSILTCSVSLPRTHSSLNTSRRSSVLAQYSKPSDKIEEARDSDTGQQSLHQVLPVNKPRGETDSHLSGLQQNHLGARRRNHLESELVGQWAHSRTSTSYLPNFVAWSGNKLYSFLESFISTYYLSQKRQTSAMSARSRTKIGTSIVIKRLSRSVHQPRYNEHDVSPRPDLHTTNPKTPTPPRPSISLRHSDDADGVSTWPQVCPLVGVCRESRHIALREPLFHIEVRYPK